MSLWGDNGITVHVVSVTMPDVNIIIIIIIIIIIKYVYEPSNSNLTSYHFSVDLEPRESQRIPA